MKKLLTVLLLCWSWAAWSQPILRNSHTTNSPGRTPNILATSTNVLYPLMVLNPDGSGADRQILFNEAMTITGTNTTLGGNLSLNGRTNIIADNGSTLTYNGSAIGGGDTTWTNAAGAFLYPTPSTNFFHTFVPSGGAFVGKNASNYFATSFSPTKDPTFFNFRDVSLGDLNVGTVLSEVADDGVAFNSGGAWSFNTATNLSSLSMLGYNSVSSVAFNVVANAVATSPFGKLTQEGTVNLVGWLFAPDTVATNTAYRFDTTRTHTTSNLLAVANNGTNKFAVLAEGQVTLQGLTNQIGDNGTTLTYNGSPIVGGDTTATNIVTLTQTGTNAAQLDFALVARGGVFKLSLTNNAYFGAPANVNNTDFKKAWLAVKQPSTGTCLVTFTNGFFAQPGGNALVNDTNAGAVVWYEMLSNPFTNGIVDVWMSQKSQLVP